MSGICGVIHWDGKPVSPDDLATMAEASTFRGPDGTRCRIDGPVGFAHLAFHVTAESTREQQPLVSPDGALMLVADVRLDNRKELAAKLDVDAVVLPDLTDPDLLLLAYRKWGEGCLDHLLGDFVFAVWDRTKQELFLARDALGAYSVSWHQSGQTFVFASETAALLDLDWVPTEVDPEVIGGVLANVPVACDRTEFSYVFYLPAAHFIRVSSSGVAVKRYWDINPTRNISYKTEGEYNEHFLELVNAAVANRLRSIRPVGISLSGGYDSTLLAAVTARQLAKVGSGRQQLKSFSYVFNHHPSCDERRFIDPVVEQYQLDATYVVADEMWSFKDIARQPVHRSSFWQNCFHQLPESVVRKAHNAGCGLLMDGEFGDALCSGESLFAADLLQRGQWTELMTLAYRHWGRLAWGRDFITLGLRPLAPRWLKRGYRKFIPTRVQPFVSGLEEHRLDALKSVPADPYASYITGQLSPGKRLRYGYLFNPSWAQSMGTTRGALYGQYGLERVSPYFDRPLVEYLMAIPTEQLGHPGHYRRLQHNAMRDLLPNAVIDRQQKTSFEPLLHRGLSRKENAELFELMSDPLVVREGWIRKDWLKEQLAATTGWEMQGYPLAMCVHLELWLRAVEDTIQNGRMWSEPFSLV